MRKSIKKLIVILSFVVIAVGVYFLFFQNSLDAISGSTLVWESGSNNFFNQEASTTLPGTKYITINGEVEKEVKIKLSRMPLRSVTVKEVRYAKSDLSSNGPPSEISEKLNFYGTYRYDGYALCDILSSIKVDKESKEEFWPPVDLYIVVSNDAGDQAVFSWGELFYSANMYSIVIAKRATRVIPGKTGVLWNLPEKMQLVVESDLISERNIPNPTKITIKSLKGDYVVNRDSTVFIAQEDKILFSETFSDGTTKEIFTITEPDPTIQTISNPTIYYGHGMGYKGERRFIGQPVSQVLAPFFSNRDPKTLRQGIVSIAGIDGYRASFSLSELINRNDERNTLLMFGCGKDKEYGRATFSIYAGIDAFADRSIKGVCEIRLIH